MRSEVLSCLPACAHATPRHYFYLMSRRHAATTQKCHAIIPKKKMPECHHLFIIVLRYCHVRAPPITPLFMPCPRDAPMMRARERATRHCLPTRPSSPFFREGGEEERGEERETAAYLPSTVRPTPPRPRLAFSPGDLSDYSSSSGERRNGHPGPGHLPSGSPSHAMPCAVRLFPSFFSTPSQVCPAFHCLFFFKACLPSPPSVCLSPSQVLLPCQAHVIPERGAHHTTPHAICITHHSRVGTLGGQAGLSPGFHAASPAIATKKQATRCQPARPCMLLDDIEVYSSSLIISLHCEVRVR